MVESCSPEFALCVSSSVGWSPDLVVLMSTFSGVEARSALSPLAASFFAGAVLENNSRSVPRGDRRVKGAGEREVLGTDTGFDLDTGRGSLEVKGRGCGFGGIDEAAGVGVGESRVRGRLNEDSRGEEAGASE